MSIWSWYPMFQDGNLILLRPSSLNGFGIILPGMAVHLFGINHFFNSIHGFDADCFFNRHLS